MFKKAAAAVMCSAMLTAALCSCGQKNISISESDTTTQASESASQGSSSQEAFGTSVANFTAPEDGETVVIMTIKDYGDIKIKLFPEYAEKGVENFTSLAEQGYYDGLTFHRIINKFMIQGGDPTGTGRGGESIWGEKFEGGTDPHLIHVSGAVAYANSGATSTNGSQFYIVTGDKIPEEKFAASYPEEAKKAYLKAGGYPWLDGSYTVFGQVYDGLDIVYKLQEVKTDANDKPETPVVIESMKVAKYDGSKLRWYIDDYSESDASNPSTQAETESNSQIDTEASSENVTDVPAADETQTFSE